MKKMDNMAQRIKASLESVPGIQYAFVCGSFAKNPEDQESEANIIVLGGPDLVEMEEVILKAEEKMGRPFLITSFTVREFQEKIRVKDEAILRALQGPKVMLLGRLEEMKAALDAQG